MASEKWPPTESSVFIWWIHGGDGWVSMLERMTEHGLEVPDMQLAVLESLIERLRKMVEVQKARKGGA